MDDLEQAIDKELEKVILDASEHDSEESEDDNFTELDGHLHADEQLPDSVLAYIQASENRMTAAEQFILEDVEEKDFSSLELPVNYRNDSRLNESAMDFIDPEKLKERVICETEERVESQNDRREVSKISYTDVETDHDSENKLQFSLEWKDLERRLKEEEEQKLAAQEVERELRLNSEREDEERRRRSLMEFEEQLRRVEEVTLLQNVGADDILYTVDLQHELDKQQEFIWKLEKELEEEKQAFEEAQEEERKRTQELQCKAATKIQAAVRGVLVRLRSTTELKRKREEEKRLEEEKREWEKTKKEREEERRRIEEEKRMHMEEMERRRREYETAKEHERHRLEKEKRHEQQRKKKEEDEERRRREMKRNKEQNNVISVEERRVKEDSQCLEKGKRREQQRKKEEEDEERRKEMKRKEEQNNVISVEERRVKEDSQCLEKEKRREQQRKKEEEDEERRREIKRKEERNFNMEERRIKEESRKQEETGNKEKERRGLMSSSRVDEESIRKEENEERGEKEIKGNEEEVGERKDNNETIRDRNEKEKNVLKKERNRTELMYRSVHVERLDDQKLQTMRNKDRSYQEEKQDAGHQELDSQMDLQQSRKNLKVTTGTSEFRRKAHQELSDDHCSSLSASPNVTGHVCSDVTQGKDIDTSLNTVEPEMDTRGHQNAIAIELENCGPEIQDSGSVCLPDSTEQKRLGWIKSCTPWSKLSLKNKQKGASAQQQSQRRRARGSKVPSLPPLSMDTILKTGAWSSLKQVTTVTLEDLPGCSLSTLSQCCKLQTVTLRRCGLRSLDGLHQCTQISYIDIQENSVTHVDCGGLENLQVLLLGRNQLTNIHGLNDAKNLHELQLSHNSISHIDGLGSLKMLQKLLVDHNQLLSTRGVNEIYTLLHLDCSYNHLSYVEGLENCVLLNTLDLRGNSLTELPVLHNHVLLRDLSLDDNLISSLCDLESYWLPLLQNLSVSHNSITDLIPLLDLVSLKTLDVSQNCLSDLQNVCLNLQGCPGLQELNLGDNPLLQEKNWRSSLLETVPGLIKLNNEQTSATSAPPKDPSQRCSFQALCQTQQRQRNLLLQRHEMEISSVSSQHDGQLLACGHHAELFRLAVEQRYSHEYGDSSVTENLTSSSAADSTQHDFTKADSQKTHLELQTYDPQTDFLDSCTKTQTEKKPVQTLNLKTTAAVVIQRCWRRCMLRRRPGGPSGLMAKTNERSNIRRVENSSVETPELPQSDRAAVVIQAAWRGCSLRRKLACALAAAQITESDEDLEEVDMDEFIFDERAMEKDWITLHSDVSPAGAMPYPTRPPLPKSLVTSSKTTSVFPRQPKHAWSDSDGSIHLEQSMSPHLSNRKNTVSERSEEILKEWGITSDLTAQLMLKRANKMKGRKQQQKRLLDPIARLVLFKSRSHQYVSTEARGTRSKFKDCFKGCQTENEAQRAVEPQNYTQGTYQWLHTQTLHPHVDAAVSERDHFLPVMDREILNGGRVQLVAGAGGRDGVDSGAKFRVDTGSPPLNKQTRARRHSTEHTKTEVPSPNRVSSAPSRNERISFRDSPVRHSGGWGGGKRRTKPNK